VKDLCMRKVNGESRKMCLRSRDLFIFWKIIDISKTVQDGHSYNGRLIGSHTWSMEWHHQNDLE